VHEALQRDDVRVVPLLVEGATMPGEGDLPPGLKALAYRNARILRPGPQFEFDLNILCERLSPELEVEPEKSALRDADIPRVEAARNGVSVRPDPDFHHGRDRSLGIRLTRALPWALCLAAVLLLIGLVIWNRPGPDGNPVARVPVRYWIDRLPNVPHGDAFKLFNNALGSWQAILETSMSRADTRENANVLIQTYTGSGTVAQVGPPKPGQPPLVVIFDPEQAWTDRIFEAASCRMIGHILGLTTSQASGQLMSDTSTGVTYETLPLAPQAEDIERVREIWGRGQ
jgi:hypothetical protein